MTNGKSGQNKLLKALASIIIVIVASFFGVNISDILPNDDANTNHEHNVVQQVDRKLMLHMIDVGQADCFLLVQGEETALVDCGTRSSGKDAVEYLKSMGIARLDYVFGTHPHDDHMGGMYDIITNFDVGKVVVPEVENGEITANWYIKLVKELKTGNYEIEYPELGSVYKLGDATMKVIGPINDANGNTNNYSTVLKVSFGEMDIIMTGDAETEVEEDILNTGENIDAEILKVGHHGSDTSTCDEFLDAIDPDYALISCKVGNKYEHPIKVTMEKLEERNIDVYRTDESDTIVAEITSNEVKFSCEPGDYLSGSELEERNAA